MGDNAGHKVKVAAESVRIACKVSAVAKRKQQCLSQISEIMIKSTGNEASFSRTLNSNKAFHCLLTVKLLLTLKDVDSHWREKNSCCSKTTF